MNYVGIYTYKIHILVWITELTAIPLDTPK